MSKHLAILGLFKGPNGTGGIHSLILKQSHPFTNYTFLLLLPPSPKTKNKVMERTFVCIKPESVRRCLVGKIIERFEANGFRLIAIKMIVATRKQAMDHYVACAGQPFFPKVISYMTSGPVVAMIWEGVGVVRGIRKILGATPDKVPPPGTLRADYRNNSDVGKYHDTVCHGSDSAEDAQREFGIWFDKSEMPAPLSRVSG